jgi:Helicase HerA, central domain
MATGAWRTAVYLLGDHDSYPRLASAWRSVLSGELSLPEPVRVFDRAEVGDLAQRWALADDEGEQGPGLYRRLFEGQTLLTTAQLASYVHLPELETPGFTIKLVPRFDVVTVPAPAAGARMLDIGPVLNNGQPTAGAYSVTLRSLTRHVFVAGITGSGKTNTIMSIVQEASAAGVPFLVIEPAKRNTAR